MLKGGILNPAINALLCRVRHTNTLVIADRGFPYWPQIETIDISLVDDLPKVIDVLHAIKENFSIGQIYAAEEFLTQNTPDVTDQLDAAILGIPISYEPHIEFKRRIPNAIGLIRTGDTTQFSNLILESA